MDILVKKIYHGKRLSNFKVYKSVYETVDETYFAFGFIWDNVFYVSNVACIVYMSVLQC